MYEAKRIEEILWKRYPYTRAITGVSAVGLQNIISDIKDTLNSNSCVRKVHAGMSKTGSR